jgi:hypothetical protein
MLVEDHGLYAMFSQEVHDIRDEDKIVGFQQLGHGPKVAQRTMRRESRVARGASHDECFRRNDDDGTGGKGSRLRARWLNLMVALTQ